MVQDFAQHRRSHIRLGSDRVVDVLWKELVVSSLQDYQVRLVLHCRMDEVVDCPHICPGETQIDDFKNGAVLFLTQQQLQKFG